MALINPLRPTGPFRPFAQIFTRAFSSTPVAAKKHSKRRLQHILRNVPLYPYPIQHTFKQSWFGLYGGKHIQFGNSVPESNYKTRRRWLPNVRHRSVFSRALNQYFSLDITTSVLRTIDKVGGLDAYLTGTKPARIKSLGPTGWRLRWRVMNSPRYQAQLAEERQKLGLAPSEISQQNVFGELATLEEGVELAGLSVEELIAEEGVEEVVAKPKTAAQLMIERIEKEKGLRKEDERV